MEIKKLATADLYSGKLTYGDFAKNRASSLLKFKADVNEINVNLTAQQKAQQESQDKESERKAEITRKHQLDHQNQSREDQRLRNEESARIEENNRQDQLIKQKNMKHSEQQILNFINYNNSNEKTLIVYKWTP